MSALTMKHDYRNSALELLDKQKREIANAFNHYLATIILAIDDCGGLIHEGNFNLFTRTDINTGERIIYMYQSWQPYNEQNEKQFNEAIVLYSEDGYESLEDIANWADIATSYRDKFVAERDKDKKGLTADEILDFVASLACSQGFYGRLLEVLRTNPDALQQLVDKKFTDTLDLVMFVECG